MVGCAHIGRAVRITANDIKQLKNREHDDPPIHRSPNSHKANGTDKNFSCWNCAACGTSESPWICLSCGLIHCGRYINGDGVEHYELEDDHAVAMDCLNYNVFCYKCDDYVAGDTMDRKIYNMRTTLQIHNAKALAESFEEGTEDEDAEKLSVSTTSNSPCDNEEESVLEDTSPGRLLRSRKRKRSPLYESGKVSVPDDRTWRGLRNLGNSCFMNAVVQALNSIPVFRDFFTGLPRLMYENIGSKGSSITSPRYKTRRYTQENEPASTETSSSSMLAEELRKTLRALSPDAYPGSYSPDALFHSVWSLDNRFAGYSQQDCHEFLRYALDQLHVDLRKCRIPDDQAWRVANECGTEYSATASAISLMFEGALQSQVTCMSCGMTSNKQDPFLDLSLDIHIPPSPNARTASTTLTECIDRFFEKEELENCEQYMCGSCQERKPSTKQLFLRSLPKILCLHLKRFRWSHASRGKMDNMVDFPLRGLDFSPYLSPNCKNRGKRCVYDLSSIIVHHGSGMGGGHYTAYGYRDGEWAHYNDSSVKSSDSETVLKQKAYVLFYTRVQ